MYNVLVEIGVLVLTQQITVVITVKISFLLVLVISYDDEMVYVIRAIIAIGLITFSFKC